MQALLGIEPLVLHALRGLVSLPVVLDLILPLGFCLDRVRCGPLFRFCGPAGCFLEGFPCPSWVLPRGRASALVGRLRQGESELESMAYCPPVRGTISTPAASPFVGRLRRAEQLGEILGGFIPVRGQRSGGYVAVGYVEEGNQIQVGVMPSS